MMGRRLTHLTMETAHSRNIEKLARRVCWWEDAETTLANPALFLCRAMVFGTWDDVCLAIEAYGEEALSAALQSAPPGLFDPRSWHYWHQRFGLLPVPPMPRRVIPA
jgi:hypothetical protein